jgi:hypothetical protein
MNREVARDGCYGWVRVGSIRQAQGTPVFLPWPRIFADPDHANLTIQVSNLTFWLTSPVPSCATIQDRKPMV